MISVMNFNNSWFDHANVIFFITAVSLLRSVRAIPQPSVDSENCVANCITQFSHDVGKNSFGMQKSLMTVTWDDLMTMSKTIRDPDELRHRMDMMCYSYTDLKRCIVVCQDQRVEMQISSGFESLEIMCVTEKDAFDKFVPCLARYEEHVMRECKAEMNASMSSVQQLQHIVATRGPIGTISMIPSMLQNVCNATYLLVQCMQAPTHEACGSEEPVYLMYKIVAVSFENFKHLYVKLGIHQPLPASCRALIDLRNLSSDMYRGREALTVEALEPTKQRSKVLPLSKSVSTGQSSSLFLILFTIICNL